MGLEVGHMRPDVAAVAGRPRSKLLAATICLSVLASNSFAISRYQTENKTCNQLHVILQRERAAILQWRSERTGMPLYERIVRNMAYCPAGQITDTSSVPAADGSCPLPKCVELEDFWTW
jgi:hypothetical protein